jgi:nucleotide-binding universal stress UspA family protein
VTVEEEQMDQRPVVAGVDGSPPSVAAAGYAAAAAHARGAPLHLVHGYLHPFGYGSAPLEPYQTQPPPPPADGEVMLGELADRLRARYPDLTVTHTQVLGGGAAALLAESTGAALVVVGCRGHGGFAGLLLGSVSAHLPAHARCPVLVVRPPAAGVDSPDATPGAPVVAGVDGSEGGDRAAGYGAAEASLAGRPLLLVTVDGTGDDPRKPLDRVAGEIRAGHPALTVDTRVVPGPSPAGALVQASRGAALLAVGSRGRGGFTGLLLGSVSQAALHHAHCPVLVVPPRAPAP